MRKTAFLAIVAFSGCAGFQAPAWLSTQQAPPPTPGDYQATAFSSAFDPAFPGARAKVHVLFDGIEDTVLDLPEEYASGWLRAVVVDPSRPATRTANVVVSESNRHYLSELPRGQGLDLFVTRALHQDPMLANGTPTVVLRVEKLRKHVSDNPGRPLPPAAPLKPATVAAAAPAPAQDAIVYGNASKKDLLTLMGDGRFELRQHGRTITGSYVLEASTLTFILPNGHKALAKREGDTLTDPDGKQWSLRK